MHGLAIYKKTQFIDSEDWSGEADYFKFRKDKKVITRWIMLTRPSSYNWAKQHKTERNFTAWTEFHWTELNFTELNWTELNRTEINYRGSVPTSTSHDEFSQQCM